MPDRTCSIQGCEKLTHARGYCSKHYWQLWRHGDAEHADIRDAAVCEWCEQPLNPRDRPAGRARSFCDRRCFEASVRARTTEQRARFRRVHTLRKYGLTEDEYSAIFEQQGGVCAVCGRPPAGRGRWPILSVDHCHRTKRVRGLLCSRCNVMLGQADDDPARLEAAAEYLRKT